MEWALNGRYSFNSGGGWALNSWGGWALNSGCGRMTVGMSKVRALKCGYLHRGLNRSKVFHLIFDI